MPVTFELKDMQGKTVKLSDKAKGKGLFEILGNLVVPCRAKHARIREIG